MRVETNSPRREPRTGALWRLDEVPRLCRHMRTRGHEEEGVLSLLLLLLLLRSPPCCAADETKETTGVETPDDEPELNVSDESRADWDSAPEKRKSKDETAEPGGRKSDDEEEEEALLPLLPPLLLLLLLLLVTTKTSTSPETKGSETLRGERETEISSGCTALTCICLHVER